MGGLTILSKPTATLKTDGATVTFTLESADNKGGDGLFTMSIAPRHSAMDFGPPIDIRLFHSDLLRLADYLKAHIELVIAGSEEDSAVYVPLELSFQLQALEGEYDSSTNACFMVVFSARYMLPDVLGGVFYGFEGTLDLTDAYRFCAELRELALAIGKD